MSYVRMYTHIYIYIYIYIYTHIDISWILFRRSKSRPALIWVRHLQRAGASFLSTFVETTIERRRNDRNKLRGGNRKIYRMIKKETPRGDWQRLEHLSRPNRVNTNGAAAKICDFDRLGKKVRRGSFGKIQVG